MKQHRSWSTLTMWFRSPSGCTPLEPCKCFESPLSPDGASPSIHTHPQAIPSHASTHLARYSLSNAFPNTLGRARVYQARQPLRSSPLLPLLCRVVRRCNKDCTVKGIPIKRGSFVVCPIYRMHYREDLWPKPDTFNPDR